MSSSNHHEKLLWIWSSASVLSLFLRHCISVFYCSLTNVQPALIKSNMRRLWPLRGSPGECPGEKMGHLEGMSSYGVMWQPCSFVGPLLPHSLIWLNWFKSQEKWCHHDRETWMGGRCSASDIIMTLALQGNRVRGRSRGSWGVAYALRTSDVVTWEAPIASVENHTVANCPVMIDGETNGCEAPLFVKGGGRQRNYTQSNSMAQTCHGKCSSLCSRIVRSLIKLEIKFTTRLDAEGGIVCNCIVVVIPDLEMLLFCLSSVTHFLSCLTLRKHRPRPFQFQQCPLPSQAPCGMCETVAHNHFLKNQPVYCHSWK